MRIEGSRGPCSSPFPPVCKVWGCRHCAPRFQLVAKLHCRPANEARQQAAYPGSPLRPPPEANCTLNKQRMRPGQQPVVQRWRQHPRRQPPGRTPQEPELDALRLLVGGCDAAVELRHRSQMVPQPLLHLRRRRWEEAGEQREVGRPWHCVRSTQIISEVCLSGRPQVALLTAAAS